MKCTNMGGLPRKPFTITCLSAVVVALVPTARAQETLQTIERSPESTFQEDQEESLAKYLSLGPISVRPHLYADSYYDDNLTLQNRSGHEDWVWRIFPGALFGVGEFRGDKGTYVSIDYTMG